MAYTKPKVVVLAPALDVINGQTSKGTNPPDDARPKPHTPAAYEADE
jgi:hypothetical protein